MNPCLILTRNNLDLTKKCVESVRGQDIPTRIMLYDNGSSDGTSIWAIREHSEGRMSYWSTFPSSEHKNNGVTKAWNLELNWWFDFARGENRAEHVLVLNNDAIIPPWFYRRLLNYDQPFITGVAVDYLPKSPSPHCPLTPNPDFSAFLIRRDAWERIGQFDESMKIYSSDQDYHIRGWMAGVPMLKANVPYLHISSQTLKRASAEDRASIQAQADADRATLTQKWGVSAGGPDYQALFSPENFGSGKTPSDIVGCRAR